MSFFEKVIKKFYPEAMDIQDNWRAKEVYFKVLHGPNSYNMEMHPDISAFGKGAKMFVRLRGDDRYKDRNEMHVLASFTISNVSFPEQPE